MPTYEYQCDYCDHNFDELQSFSDEPLKICPACGMDALRRLIGCGAGFIFKGAGFYCNDYSGKPTPKDRMEEIGNLESKHGTEELANRYEKNKEKQEKK